MFITITIVSSISCNANCSFQGDQITGNASVETTTAPVTMITTKAQSKIGILPIRSEEKQADRKVEGELKRIIVSPNH